MARLTETEREIVEHLYAHGALNEEPSLTGLANECHVAKSTVIKTLQKLGFSGFQDYLYTYQTRSSISSDNILPEPIVEGDFAAAAETLAACLERCEGRNNICYSGGEITTRPIAEHINRKLNIFGLSATASYDYGTFDALAPNAGVMFLFFENLPKSALGKPTVQPAFESLLSYAEGRGFTTVGILDAGFPVALPSLDVTIKLARTRDNAMHLFAVKTLMLFEEALATFSAQRAADDNARHSETLAVHHAPSSLVNPAHSEEAPPPIHNKQEVADASADHPSLRGKA